MSACFRFCRILLARRSAVCALAAAGLFHVCSPLPVVAQQPPVKDNRYTVIDAEEGQRRMAAFRRQRLDGDYCFRFELEHLPRRGKSQRYYGTLWGSWNEQGPVSRIELAAEPGTALSQAGSRVEMIFQNGPQPSAWLRTAREADFHQLNDDALLQPILPGIAYTPFDLQMPLSLLGGVRLRGAGTGQVAHRPEFCHVPTGGDPGDGFRAYRHRRYLQCLAAY